MTILHVLQLVVLGALLGVAFPRIWVLLVPAPIGTGPFLKAVRGLLDQGQRAAALALAQKCRPSFVARLCEARLAAADPEEGEQRAHELLAELDHESTRGIYATRVLARMASPLGLMVAVFELGMGFQGGSGLVALQKGLAATLGLQHAVLALSLGMGSSLVGFVAAGLLQRHSSALRSDLVRAYELGPL